MPDRVALVAPRQQDSSSAAPCTLLALGGKRALCTAPERHLLRCHSRRTAGPARCADSAGAHLDPQQPMSEPLDLTYDECIRLRKKLDGADASDLKDILTEIKLGRITSLQAALRLA